ncbi:hypothetical protein B0T25DRAFT_444928, partial [Lasiosphaeria hispida]
SEPWTHVKKKAMEYIQKSDGKIRVVLIIDAHYPNLRKATVSLLVADDGGGFHWHLNRKVIHDDRLHRQPSGKVKFYLSDFLGPEGLPIDFCRPPARISRSPFFTVSYKRLGAIFRTARHAQHPDVFAMAEEDMETNLFEEMQQELKRHTAEAERRIAEERRQREESDKRAAESEKRAAELDKRAAKLDKRAAKDHRRLARLERVIAEAGLRVPNAKRYAAEECRQRKKADKRAAKAERRNSKDIRSKD